MNFSFRLVFFFLLGWFVASLFRCAPTKRAGEFDNDRSGNIPIGFGGAVGGLGGSGSGGTFGAAAIAADMDSVREQTSVKSTGTFVPLPNGEPFARMPLDPPGKIGRNTMRWGRNEE